MELWNPTAKATTDRKLFIGYFVDLIIVKQVRYNNRHVTAQIMAKWHTQR